MEIARLVQRAAYTAKGAINYHIDRRETFDNPKSQPRKKGPHVIFNFWYAPPYQKSRELMEELLGRFAGNGLPIGVGLFIRPMGDVKPNGFDYDPESMQGFLQAAHELSLPTVLQTSGDHWTEVAYKVSPLIRMLEADSNNLMQYINGSRVQRKLQPPGSVLKGRFGSDFNGVVYFSYHSAEVAHYRERNLGQAARAAAEIDSKYTDLLLAMSIEQERDYPGIWITGRKKAGQAGYELPSRQAFAKAQVGRNLTFAEFKEETVRRVMRADVEILRRAGISGEKIYTNQSVEDSVNRASPITTADIPNSNGGITTWGLGNGDLYREMKKMAVRRGKKWALMVTNSLSFSESANREELESVLRYDPEFIGGYCWEPHFPGYVIRGMAFERAIKSRTR